MLLDSENEIYAFCRFISSLRFPNLNNKSFLDLGSNNLKMISFASFSGAKPVVWMSDSANNTENFDRSLASVEGYPLNLELLSDKKFDVIYLNNLLLSRNNFKDFVSKAMQMLSQDGLLVTDIFLIDDNLLSSSESNFFSRRFVSKQCDSYAWKIFGKSLNEESDFSHRVLHIKKRKPYVFLMMEKPGSGKSTLSRFFFKANKVPVLSGDGLYIKIANGDISVPEPLLECVRTEFRRYAIDKTIHKVFKNNLYGEFFSVLLRKSQNKDIAIDTYVPSKYWSNVVDLMRSKGYFPVVLGWEGRNDLITAKETNQLVENYQKYLLTYPFVKQVKIIKKYKNKSINDFKWHVDTPKNGDLVGENIIKVSGWVCFNKEMQPELKMALFCNNENYEFCLNKDRNDVRNALSPVFNRIKQSSDSSPLGFSFMIDRSLLEGSVLSVIYENRTIDLIGFELDSPGRKSWFSFGKKD